MRSATIRSDRERTGTLTYIFDLSQMTRCTGRVVGAEQHGALGDQEFRSFSAETGVALVAAVPARGCLAEVTGFMYHSVGVSPDAAGALCDHGLMRRPAQMDTAGSRDQPQRQDRKKLNSLVVSDTPSKFRTRTFE
jgi:hypothetical protein